MVHGIESLDGSRLPKWRTHSRNIGAVIPGLNLTVKNGRAESARCFQQSTFAQPLQGALLPGIPFLALVAVVTVVALRELLEFRRNTLGLERLVEYPSMQNPLRRLNLWM